MSLVKLREAALKRRLQPGDVLLYHTSGFMGWWIRVKTFSDINHVETYIGDGRSFSARNEGVHIYPLRVDGLRYVLRPVTPYDNAAASAWRKTVLGQKYDFLGLAIFYLAAKAGAPDRMFCSEACTRDARAGGLVPFPETTDADRVPPSYFLTSLAYRIEVSNVEAVAAGG